MAFTGNFLSDTFKIGLRNADFDFAPGTTDVYKIALYTNAATLDATTPAYTTAGEVVASGYTAGGEVLTPVVGFTNGVSFITFNNVSWSGAFTARGALIYKDGGAAVCVLDFGSDKTSVTTFPVQFPVATSADALIRFG
jgi:hypothetical protein